MSKVVTSVLYMKDVYIVVSSHPSITPVWYIKPDIPLLYYMYIIQTLSYNIDICVVLSGKDGQRRCL